MENIPWILIGVATLIVLFGFMFLFRKNTHTINYYNLFIIGIIWMIIGIPTKNSALSIVGIVLVITGLVHRKDWKKNKKNWKYMNKKEKKFYIWILIILLLIFIMGIVVGFFAQQGIIFAGENSKINSFEECIDAGNPVMESYPRQCRTGDDTFTEVVVGDYFQG